MLEGRGASASDLSIDFPIDHIRAMAVTYVHIDHVGLIPYLLAAGFDGLIICSEPPAIMLPEIPDGALKIGFTRDKQLIERFWDLIRSRLVPVFSMVRTQELLYEIESLSREFRAELWSKLEVIVDSPLAAEFTLIYRDLKPYWDA